MEGSRWSRSRWRRFFHSIYTRTLLACALMLVLSATIRIYYVSARINEEVAPLVRAEQQAAVAQLALGLGQNLVLRQQLLEQLARSAPQAADGAPLRWQAWLNAQHAVLGGLFPELAVLDPQQRMQAHTGTAGGDFLAARASSALQLRPGYAGSQPALAMLWPLPGHTGWQLRAVIPLGAPGLLDFLAPRTLHPARPYLLTFPATQQSIVLALPLAALQAAPSSAPGATAELVSATVAGTDWHISTTLAAADIQSAVQHIQDFALRSTLVHLGTMVIFVLCMLTLFLRPLKRAAHHALQMARGEQPLKPLQIVFHDEVGALTAAFNLLLQRLGQQSTELTVQMQKAETAALARSRFLAAASHDLRQPMHALNLYLGALNSYDLPPNAQPVLVSARQCARTMDEMFRALLDISRLDASALRVEASVFPIALVLDKIGLEFAQQAAEKGLRLRVAPCSAVVHSDLELVQRILRNLVSNAVRYTEQGKILVGCRRVGGRVRLTVCDTGVGIAAHDQAAVFEEFYQVGNPERDRAQGLGLGLAIVQRLALLLDAPLALRSQPGCGAMFTVDLPSATASYGRSAATTAEQRNTPAVQHSPLVAVVDDEALIRDAMALLLTRAGYLVVVASSGAEILATLAASARAPDAIICDHRLRHQETGIDVIHALREEFNADIPALLITGDTSPEQIQAMLATGIPLLHKPLQDYALLAALAALWRDGP